eukprot:jgi/Phyca11/15853/fgenesh1_pg.PHYCAscaffold_16_\
MLLFFMFFCLFVASMVILAEKSLVLPRLTDPIAHALQVSHPLPLGPGDDDESQDIRVLELEREGARKTIEAETEAKQLDLLSNYGDMMAKSYKARIKDKMQPDLLPILLRQESTTFFNRNFLLELHTRSKAT